MLCRVLLHAVNLRHGTDGFTSPPKEVRYGFLSPVKIHRPRSGLNPQQNILWVQWQAQFRWYIKLNITFGKTGYKPETHGYFVSAGHGWRNIAGNECDTKLCYRLDVCSEGITKKNLVLFCFHFSHKMCNMSRFFKINIYYFALLHVSVRIYTRKQ
jgi:hypothetical protein